MSEFTRMIDLRHLPAAPVEVSASDKECAALAARFGLVAVRSLTATVTLKADGAIVSASGKLIADVVQSCAVSGDDLPARIAEPVNLRFVPAQSHGAEEVELEAGDLDEIEYTGLQFDLGEALAQTMALGIDPYAEGPGADAARRKAGLLGEQASGPFAALAGLKTKSQQSDGG